MVLKKTLKSLLDSKIKAVNPKGNQHWIFIHQYSLMLELKLQYSGYRVKIANTFDKAPDAGKNWGQEEKGMTEY